MRADHVEVGAEACAHMAIVEQRGRQGGDPVHVVVDADRASLGILLRGLRFVGTVPGVGPDHRAREVLRRGPQRGPAHRHVQREQLTQRAAQAVAGDVDAAGFVLCDQREELLAHRRLHRAALGVVDAVDGDGRSQKQHRTEQTEQQGPLSRRDGVERFPHTRAQRQEQAATLSDNTAANLLLNSNPNARPGPQAPPAPKPTSSICTPGARCTCPAPAGSASTPPRACWPAKATSRWPARRSRRARHR